MTDFQYLTYAECIAAGYTPEPMLFDEALAAHGLRVAPFATTRTEAPRDRKTEKRRVYKSKYVGVTTHQGKFVAQWRQGKYYKRGPRRDSDEMAARDRARALGKKELEVRG